MQTDLTRWMMKAHAAADTAIQRVVRDLTEQQQREVYEYIRDEIEMQIEAMASSPANSELNRWAK